MSGPSLSVRPGRFDQGEWRRSIRKGRERAMGIDPNGLAPLYRVWGSTDRPRAVISLKVPS